MNSYDYQIAAIIADFGTQVFPDADFLDTKVENRVGKNIFILSSQVRRTTANSLQLDSTFNLTQRDDACKEFTLRFAIYPSRNLRCSVRPPQCRYDISVDYIHSEGHIARIDLLPFDLATREGQ